MDIPDVKPDLSLLEIPCIAKNALPHETFRLPGVLSIYNYTDTFSNILISSEANEQQTESKLRQSDNHFEEDGGVNKSSSVPIKIEQNETGQPIHEQQSPSPVKFLFPIPINIKQENTSREEIPTQNDNENMKRQVEGKKSQFTECDFYFSLESKEQTPCVFPGCPVLCLGQEEMDHHFYMRHATVNLNTTTNNNNNYDNDFPSLSLSSSSSLSKSREKKKNNSNNNYYNSTASSSSTVFSSKPPVKDSFCKIQCDEPDCSRRYYTWEHFYKHQLRVHNLIPPPNTIETFTCTDPDCLKVFVSEMDMKIHFQEFHDPTFVKNDWNPTEFKCPVPSCESRSFGKIGALEKHCITYHPDEVFPWLSPEKNIKCLMPGCTRTFNRQTCLESHMKCKHGGKNAHLLYFPSSTSATSTFASAAAPRENQPLFKCLFAKCSFSTFDVPSFEHHQRLHTGDIPRFRCNFENCGICFIDEAVMIEHRKVIHGMVE